MESTYLMSATSNQKTLAPVWILVLATGAGAIRLLANVFSAFNAAPVAATATFTGARLRIWQAMLAVMGIMVATDLALWTMHAFDTRYTPWDALRLWVYPCLLVNVILGACLVRSPNYWRFPQIGVASLLGSVQFFLVTNFACWLDPRFGYATDWPGLLDCYIRALPFWRSTLASDVLFTFGLFGCEALAVYLAQRRLAAVEPSEVPTGVQG